MANFFDFLAIREDEFFTGTYYSKRPKTTEDYGETFSYDIEDPQTESVENIIGAVETLAVRFSIKTIDSLAFKAKGYVVTQEEDLYQIESVEKRPKNGEKDVYRLWKNPPRQEKILRMIKVQNPWGLK